MAPYGKVEAEGNFALEPGLDSVAVGGEDLRRSGVGEGGHVLIEDFAGRFYYEELFLRMKKKLALRGGAGGAAVVATKEGGRDLLAV